MLLFFWRRVNGVGQGGGEGKRGGGEGLKVFPPQKHTSKQAICTSQFLRDLSRVAGRTPRYTLVSFFVGNQKKKGNPQKMSRYFRQMSQHVATKSDKLRHFTTYSSCVINHRVLRGAPPRGQQLYFSNCSRPFIQSVKRTLSDLKSCNPVGCTPSSTTWTKCHKLS